MKNFIKIVLPVWVLIIFAFWIGSACTWISLWSAEYRGVMVAVLIFALLPATMAAGISKSNDDDKLKKS